MQRVAAKQSPASCLPVYFVWRGAQRVARRQAIHACEAYSPLEQATRRPRNRTMRPSGISRIVRIMPIISTTQTSAIRTQAHATIKNHSMKLSGLLRNDRRMRAIRPRGRYPVSRTARAESVRFRLTAFTLHALCSRPSGDDETCTASVRMTENAVGADVFYFMNVICTTFSTTRPTASSR